MKPIIIECFADNGTHSHWNLVDKDTGRIMICDVEATQMAFVLQREDSMHKPNKVKLHKIIDGLHISYRSDGPWLHIEASNGTKCSFSVENKFPRICGKAVLQWVRDITTNPKNQSENQGGAPVKNSTSGGPGSA